MQRAGQPESQRGSIFQIEVPQLFWGKSRQNRYVRQNLPAVRDFDPAGGHAGVDCC